MLTQVSWHIDETRIQLSDGEFHPSESWVYVWIRPSGEVLYIGATGLPLAARVWLHVNDERPEVGRVRAIRPDALVGEVEVRGLPYPTSWIAVPFASAWNPNSGARVTPTSRSSTKR